MPSAEILRSVLNAGKHAISASTRKHAIVAKQGKTCNWCQASQNMQLVPSEGNHIFVGKEISYSELSLDAKEKKNNYFFLFRQC